MNETKMLYKVLYKYNPTYRVSKRSTVKQVTKKNKDLILPVWNFYTVTIANHVNTLLAKLLQ